MADSKLRFQDGTWHPIGDVKAHFRLRTPMGVVMHDCLSPDNCRLRVDEKGEAITGGSNYRRVMATCGGLST